MKVSSQRYTSIGGQAVIEGVMMRSPHFMTIAVRKANSQIVIRSLPYRSFLMRIKWFRKPLLRGVATLIESMAQGVEALSFSASVAGEGEEEEEQLSKWAIAGSIFFAFCLGIGLFVALPHLLAAFVLPLIEKAATADSFLFHLVDGVIKMAILLIYVYLIAMMKDIHRVFQYHGAEHKSIYAFEAGDALTVENAKKYPTLHPRCGTSFLLFLVVISILVFSAILPLFHLTTFSQYAILNHTLMVLVKIVLMLPVAGLAYEFIKMCAFRMDSPFFRLLIWPGMMLQKLTTREPDADQLEVALASLKRVLLLEEEQQSGKTRAQPDEPFVDLEIQGLSDLGVEHAKVTDFLEAT